MLIHPEFEKIWKESTDADLFYLKKYDYLKKYGFFSEPKSVNFGTIDESTVRDIISQTTMIVFETTDFCNLNCMYCSFGVFYEGFEARNQKNININHAITLLKYIFNIKPKNKTNKLSIGFYGGEPLFNGKFIMQIIDVINRLKSEKEMEVEYNITTNATLIHKYIHFLVENKFELLISLDGNEKNHSYRFFKANRENSFGKVIENIDMIQSNYPEYFKKYVNFNAVLHDRNSVKEIYEFIYSRYHKIPRIAELASDDMNPDKKDFYNRMFHSKRKSEAEYLNEEPNMLPHEELFLFKELIDFLKYYSINFYVSNITDLLYGEKKYVPTNTCLPFWKKIMLTTNSKLMPCEKVNYLKYSMGEVNENVMIDIPEITRKYNYYYDHIKKHCQHCYINKFCGVCLFLTNNLDELEKKNFICENFHDQKSFNGKLHRIFSFLEKYPKDFFQITENVTIE
jgi:uncharacterized protein